MENFLLGLLTGGSLILAIGPQNLFVIEQGLKNNFVFSVTTICAVSDILLILLGIFIYNIFDEIPLEVEIILNILLILFLIMYIKGRIVEFQPKFKFNINKVISYIKKRNVDYHFISASENSAWLLNIRGSDTNYTPLPYCKILISKNKNIKLFCNLGSLISRKRKVNLNFSSTLLRFSKT